MGNGMNKILPGLFIGNFKDARDVEQLSKNNITHILSIHDSARPMLEVVSLWNFQAFDPVWRDGTWRWMLAQTKLTSAAPQAVKCCTHLGDITVTTWILNQQEFTRASLYCPLPQNLSMFTAALFATHCIRSRLLHVCCFYMPIVLILTLQLTKVPSGSFLSLNILMPLTLSFLSGMCYLQSSGFSPCVPELMTA